jgi:hypothetical protein
LAGITPISAEAIQRQVMVHIPPKKIHSIDPESRVAEIGLLDAEIVTLRADNRSLSAMNKVLEKENQALHKELEELRIELKEQEK